ncbi:hypothetical protein MCBRY_000645 [Methylocystis bryophila]
MAAPSLNPSGLRPLLIDTASLLEIGAGFTAPPLTKLIFQSRACRAKTKTLDCTLNRPEPYVIDAVRQCFGRNLILCNVSAT